jgi:hypothetical protein
MAAVGEKQMAVDITARATPTPGHIQAVPCVGGCVVGGWLVVWLSVAWGWSVVLIVGFGFR